VIQVEKPKKKHKPRPPVFRDPPRVIRSKLRFFLALLCIFLAAGVFYWFIRSDFFAVSSVKVRGQVRLLDADIIESTGLTAGVNIWQVDITRLEEHLLENRRIKAVFVQKHLPDTIVISVSEYGSAALVPTQTGFAEIDENQTVMAFPRSIGGISLPIVTGVMLDQPVIGEKASAPYLEDALACALEAKNEQQLALVEIHLDDFGNITLVSREGIRIILGTYQGSYREAFDVLEPILIDIRANQSAVQYIDMRVPNKPVVKMK
jgi:cell division protein FtsQ